MTVSGLCRVCDRPTTKSCTVCGQPVCTSHIGDGIGPVCTSCVRGKTLHQRADA